MLTGFLIIRENRIAEKCKLVSAIFLPFLIFLMGMAMTRNLEAEEAGPLRLIQTIPLRNGEGRIDHMAVDLKGERLFIAALGNNTVEIVDLRAGKHMETITGLHEPQGVGFDPECQQNHSIRQCERRRLSRCLTVVVHGSVKSIEIVR